MKPTIASVTRPPAQTEAAAPISPASIPLSNAPSSLDEPTNTDFTAETRPRMAFGEASRKMARRITTLVPSHSPATNSATSDSASIRDSPNTTMLTPNPPTTISNAMPALRCGKKRPASSAAASAPAALADRSRPNPTAPTCSTSVANTGSSAVAPPKKTANRSSAMEPSRIWSRKT